MTQRFMLFFTAFFLSISLIAQNTIKLTGKVLNEKNEPLSGVSIKIIDGGGTTTDNEGRFSLNLATGKKYDLEFTAVGYNAKPVSEVEVISGQLNELNIVLEVKSQTADNVLVTASRSSARKETVNAIIAFQKNTNTVASVISAESIRRSPDKNTGEVLKRTPGASIQEGKFIIIRGLADRYNQAMLNGILLTSTEPDRKTFSFDLIPAAMIDNIIINKAFVPELPGEWAGGLIQVNTKDIPSKNFFNVQLGTSINSKTVGKTFYKDKGGKLDWLGIDDGIRGFPTGYTTKYQFGNFDKAQKAAIGKGMRNAWVAEATDVPVNISFQANGGFSGEVFGKKVGANFGITYSRTSRYLKLLNRKNNIVGLSLDTIENDFNDDRYLQEVSAGALGSVTVQLNPSNKISLKSIINVNTANQVTFRNGSDINRNETLLTGTEFRFKQNTFFTSQLTGEHTLAKSLRLKWYGAFNILDGYIPDQRRILYSRATPQDPFTAIIANSLSQQSGSRIFQSLSDYIYTGGADLTYNFNWLDQKQTLKGGYMMQVKDRLFDAILFANYLPTDNLTLRQLTPDKIFAPENFGDGSINSNQFAFDAIIDRTYRYMANTILNAGYLQMDNQFTKNLRVVWGLRVENYDQLVGSVKKWDTRHTYSKVTDFLPGVNATLKLNAKTNLRLSGSQTVIRPELRELAPLNLYDFELNASVQGNPNLKRTKILNTDLRYELYPRAGEMFTLGVFYKHFDKPIEQLLNEGVGGSSTFIFENPESATAYGAEFEFRKKLDFAAGLKNFTLQANASYIYSRVKDEGFDVDRTLQGQSPYVLNLGLLYDVENIGFSSTLLYNRVGERIYLVGDKTLGADDPNIFEAPRSLLDLQFSKKLIKNKAELKLSISDILNQKQYFYQNLGTTKESFQVGVDASRFNRVYGTTYSITFNYSL